MKKSEEVSATMEGEWGLQLRSSMIPQLLRPNHLVRPATAYMQLVATLESPDSWNTENQRLGLISRCEEIGCLDFSNARDCVYSFAYCDSIRSNNRAKGQRRSYHPP